MLPSSVTEDLTSRFKLRFQLYSSQVKARVSLTIDAFANVRFNIPAVFEIDRFLREQSVQSAIAFQNGLEQPKWHPLSSSLILARDALAVSSVISFVKPFTPGNGDSGAIPAKAFLPFIKEDMVPILSSHSGIDISGVITKAIERRDQILAHTDAKAFEMQQSQSGFQFSPKEPYDNTDLTLLKTVSDLMFFGLSPLIRLWHE